MEASENNENKKKGFLALLSKFFGSSSAATGGGAASGGMASASGLGGLFASKAGIVGMVLGGATIAAGVGVIYNFVGPSSKPVYSPDLFEKQYYEAQVESAGEERAAVSKSVDGMSSSSLDYFREQAKKDGFSLAEDGEAGEPAAVVTGDDASSVSSGDSGLAQEGSASASDMPRLQKAASFGASGGGAKTKLSTKGGMFKGIGSKFQNVYRPAIKKGKVSSMKGAVASRINKSAKYNIPNYNRKGVYGQMKHAGSLSASAKYSSSDAGAKTTAVEAFGTQTAGDGDIGTPNMGAGLGGAGISNGQALKGSDPSLNSSEYTPPKPPAPTEDSPWKKYEDMALYGMIGGAVLVLLSAVLSNKAKALVAAGPAGIVAAAIWFKAAMAAAVAAIAAALVVVYCGMKMMTTFDQKWMGIMYMLVGGALVMQAYKALTGIKSAMASAKSELAAAKAVAAKSAAGEGLKEVSKQTTIGEFGQMDI